MKETASITRKVIIGHLLRCNKPVMLFSIDCHAIFVFFKCKKSDKVISHELSRYWAAYQLWEFRGAQRKILFNLDYANLIIAAFRLNRKYVLCAPLIDTYVDFICFNLPHVWNGCPKMILK